MQNTTTLRDALAHAFETNSYDVVLELLGFEPPSSSVPLPISGHCFYCGSRGTTICFLVHLAHADVLPRVARALRERHAAQFALLLFVQGDRLVFASYALGEHLLTLSIGSDRIHESDIETLQEMLPNGEEGSLLAARYGRALDRSRITARFFRDFAAQRDRVSSGWTGIPVARTTDRNQLALLLLSRLMFLYFLQHRGFLGSDRAFLVRLFHSRDKKRSFYVSTLKVLFFGVLNRRPERRRTTAFDALPYLNGGLFERHALERKYPRLDLPDVSTAKIFEDLLERYRFTTRETVDALSEGVIDVGVDPEMLGRVFEGLMSSETREKTGSFYTPSETVDRLVANAVAALEHRRLRDVRVLDPACGSGAFLLGALSHIARQRARSEQADELTLRRDLVAGSLFGVDVQSDAAMLCALRLWLALVPGVAGSSVQPLPNLDRQIRQGDALVDPLDLRTGSADSEVRRRVMSLQPLLTRYATADPTEKPALQRQIRVQETSLS